MKHAEERSILRNTIIINLVIPFLMFMHNQIITNVFNPYVNVGAAERLFDAVFKNIYIFIFLGLGIPAALFIGYFIMPVRKALSNSELISKAQQRIIRLPWIIFLIYITGFLSGPIVAYLLPSDLKLNEFEYVFPVSFFGGFYALSFSLILMDTILFPVKKLWGMHILSEKQKELSLTVKYVIAVIAIGGLIYAVSQSIGYFYYVKGAAADTGNLFLIMLVNIGLLLMLGILQVYLITGNLISMIKYMRNSLDDIIKGKGDLTSKISIISFDEIGMLTSDFNRLFGFLDNMIGKIKQISININKSRDILIDSIGNNRQLFESFIDSTNKIINEINMEFTQSNILNEAAQKTLDSSNLIKNSVEKQMNSVDYSVSSAQQIVQSIRNVNSITQSLKNSIKGLLDNINQGKKSLKDSIESIHLINDSSKSLLQFNRSISDVSERIKILSINASIEAVNAGRAGLGFGVVAREVKKLSDSSADNVKNIEKMIAGMNAKISEGTDLINKTAEMLESIFERIEFFIQSLENISVSMEEQETGTNTIIHATDDVLTQSKSLFELSHAGDEQSRQMKGIADNFVDMSNRIFSLAETQKDKNQILNEVNSNFTQISDTIRKIFDELNTIMSEFVISK